MAVLRTGFRCYYFSPVWEGTGVWSMTRFSAAALILSWLAFFSSFPAIAQSDPSQCFPWQEFKNGTCVAKPSQAPPPLPADAPVSSAPPCTDGTRSLSGQCTCPINMHLERGRCTADASISTPATPAITPAAIAPPIPPPLPQPTRKADEPLLCDGGTASSGRCVCPAGYIVMPPRGGGSGGTCVRTDAANCQGGELTVSGACMCNGQVIMSGETYLLEYTNGKCVPKRCPVSTEMRDGKCTSVSAVTPASAPEPEPKAKPKPQAKPKPKPKPKVAEETDEPEQRPTPVTVRPQAQPQPQRSQGTQWPDPPSTRPQQQGVQWPDPPAPR